MKREVCLCSTGQELGGEGESRQAPGFIREVRVLNAPGMDLLDEIFNSIL